jgi:hypothetical protein
MLVRHTVKDFAVWKEVYDSVAELRASNGELSDHIYRDSIDPNSLTIMFKWDSEKAGVEGAPDITFLTEI